MDGTTHEFGISGRLYKANVLLYDRTTESLWSQVKKEAVTGPLTGAKLNPIPSTLTTWKRWKKLHPQGLVLTTNTGFSRNYDANPYKEYFSNPLRFLGFKGERDERLLEKELVLGLEIKGKKRAYPFSVLKEVKSPVKDELGGMKIRIHFDKDSEEAYAVLTPKDGKGEGKRLIGLVSYWFVWSAFHPDTEVYKVK